VVYRAAVVRHARPKPARRRRLSPISKADRLRVRDTRGHHIAARALGEAGGQEVLLTRTVRELATGTDLVFRLPGSVGLKGIPGEWELFEASIA
jgi:hypothetical protein